jgi:eukaryotic-like serine/threonine-protein kinase
VTPLDHSGATPADRAAELNAALAGRYTIERELGRGGMATVYLANDPKHDRFVALKTLRPDIAVALGRDRFLREIRLAARLQHPNILPVYDSGEASGILYYLMPYVEGESLRDRLHREPQLPLDEAVQIAREVAEALSYAHAHDVVHRDIKPENIMLSGGHAMVTDFGIARAISAAGGDQVTQTGLAIGTPAYMSPEQSAGGSVDRRSDIYSLGCVLYETLAGLPPFTGPTAQAIMARHSLDSVPRLKIVRESIPDALEAVINRALSKVPADRQQTAAQFAEAVVTASTGRVSRVTAESLGRVRRPWRRPAVVVAGIVILGGLAWLGVQLSRGVSAGAASGLDPKRVAVQYFTDESPDSSLRHVADGLTEGLIAELAHVRALDVVSRNGVAPFRGSGASRDSVARALQAGSLIEGNVESVSASRVRVTVRLVDGSSGADLERASFVLPSEGVLVMQDSMVHEVARLLRTRLGDEVRIRERRAATASEAAWTLVQRGEKERKAAETARGQGDTSAAAIAARIADSLFAVAEREDQRWAEPSVLRGQLALAAARASREPTRRAQWAQTGLIHADEALERDRGGASALALRGMLRYWLWRSNQESDPARRKALLDSTQLDLQAAVRADPLHAQAHAALSQLYFTSSHLEDVVSGVLEARLAYEADAYLREAETLVDRLFWGSYDIAQFDEARRWCHEGARRFPANWRFAECRQWLLLVPGTEPDVDAGWGLMSRADSLTPAPQRPFQHHLRLLIQGGVIGRAGLRDSAEQVFARARTTDPAIDADQDLVGYEAVMRAQIGDREGAVALLRSYVATHPDHAFKRGGTLHWWWRGLEPLPGFQAVLRSAK